jgi:hypothetical protein
MAAAIMKNNKQINNRKNMGTMLIMFQMARPFSSAIFLFGSRVNLLTSLSNISISRKYDAKHSGILKQFRPFNLPAIISNLIDHYIVLLEAMKAT